MREHWKYALAAAAAVALVATSRAAIRASSPDAYLRVAQADAPSSVSGGVPAWQSLTASQVSAPSQNCPLSQMESSDELVQPDPTSHVSIVQPTPSSHTASSGVFTQDPELQTSVVQAIPSLQSASTRQLAQTSLTSSQD